MKSRQPPPARDQAPSVFSRILQDLVESAGGVAAAFVDREGETVDYAGALDPYEIKVAAAEWRLVLQALEGSSRPEWASTRQLSIRGRRTSYVVCPVSEGYAVVLVMPRGSLGASERALDHAARHLCAEAGLELPSWQAQRTGWQSVNVQADPSPSRRPRALEGNSEEEQAQPVEVLGRFTEPHFRPGEVGFRVRLQDGNERNLVREPFDRWYLEPEG